ncbi:unnamed protein product [Ectocarpus sp. 6 AP-2014]
MLRLATLRLYPVEKAWKGTAKYGSAADFWVRPSLQKNCLGAAGHHGTAVRKVCTLPRREVGGSLGNITACNDRTPKTSRWGKTYAQYTNRGSNNYGTSEWPSRTNCSLIFSVQNSPSWTIKP